MCRVEWREVKDGELFYVIADRTRDGWEFWDKSSWEHRWYPRTPTDELAMKAESLERASATAASAA
jgi:hypothetical protein